MINTDKKALLSWPENGAEMIGRCPICDCDSRRLLHQALTDGVFFCAPGKWDMQQCTGCEAAYLDPRPTSESIHLAYQNYFTHGTPGHDAALNMAWSHRVRRALSNGYRNWRYGTLYQPSSRFGPIAAYLMPLTRRRIDDAFRHIPRRTARARLMDVGFGSGEFLELAAAAGWEVAGVDMDPVVVANAKARGLNVRHGGLESWDDQPGSFDSITISHVIEHVYDPVHTLQLAHRLLKPGGYLWIDTPNLESFGHAHFGAHWRGLETPRHLVIFGQKSMKYALEKAGFSEWKSVRRFSVAQPMFLASERMRHGTNPYSQEFAKTSFTQKLIALAGMILNKRSEFITLMVKKSP